MANQIKLANRLRTAWNALRGKIYVQPTSRLGYFGYNMFTLGENEDIAWSKFGAALAAIGNHAAYACISRRAEEFGALNYRIVDNWTDKTIATSNDYNVNEPVMRSLRRFQHRYDGVSLFYMWQLHKSITGEVYIELLRNDIRTREHPNGFPADLEFLNSLATTPYAPRGIIERFEYSGQGRIERLPLERVVYDRYYSNILTEVFGYSPIMTAIGNGSVNIMRSAGRAALAYFQNDGVQGAIAQPDIRSEVQQWNDEEQGVIEKALQLNKGAANKYKMQIFPYPIDIKVFDAPDLQKWAELLSKIEPQIYTVYRVPRSVAGDSDSTRYQASPDDIPNFNRLIVSECRSIAGVMNANIIPFFYGQNPFVRFEFDLSPYETVNKDSAAIAADAFSRGAVSLNEYRVKAGFEEKPEYDVLVLPPGAVLVKVDEFGKYVQQSPSMPLPFGDGAMQLPAEQPVQTALDATKAEGKPLFVALDLGGSVDLIGLQQRLKELFPDPAVKWTPTDELHVTVLYAPAVDEQTAEGLIETLASIEMPELSLGVGGLRTFDNVGEYALHFRVRENADLREFQDTVYHLCTEGGVQTSGYSSPDAYIPHITMAYLPEKTKMMPYSGKITIKPTALFVKYGDEEVHRTGQVEAEVDVKAKAMQSDALAELRAWNHHVKRNRKWKFTPFHTKGVVAAFVQLALEDGNDINETFKTARDLVNGMVTKAYANTRDSFIREITGYFRAAAADETTRRNFSAKLRASLRKYGLMALRDGMLEVGVDNESFSPEELAAFRNWQNEQSGYVTNLGAEIFGQGITQAEAEMRVQMWAGMSLEGARQLGVLLAKPQQKMKWVEGGTRDKCSDCLRLNGQVHTMEEWIKSGYTPTSGKTECKSFNCQCQLIPTDEPIKGNF